MVTHDEALATRCARILRLADGASCPTPCNRLQQAIRNRLQQASRDERRAVGMGGAWRLARRGLDWKFRGLRLLVVCLVLGTAALAAIGTLTQSIGSELAQRGQAMLGGDVEIEIAGREAFAPEQRRLRTGRNALHRRAHAGHGHARRQGWHGGSHRTQGRRCRLAALWHVHPRHRPERPCAFRRKKPGSPRTPAASMPVSGKACAWAAPHSASRA
jgi:hypothetical protein